jgi:hypothetical protein
MNSVGWARQNVCELKDMGPPPLFSFCLSSELGYLVCGFSDAVDTNKSDSFRELSTLGIELKEK